MELRALIDLSIRYSNGMSMLRQYQIDAFTSRPFAGNPAAVIPLDHWISDERMQAIAAENNLSETAYFVPINENEAEYHLRWFTPKVEVDLCGHATLASAHTLYRHLGRTQPSVIFHTRSGELRVERDAEMVGRYAMDFPSIEVQPVELPNALIEALGRCPAELHRSSGDKGKRKLLAVFDSKRDIHELRPDMSRLAAITELTGCLGVICTAPGASHDIVSRFFAPGVGVNEDPVTGSAHCVMAPYWASRLGRNKLSAHQVSSRGGEMLCEVKGDRVRLTGDAVSVMETTILV
jgi:PhzF family phenazine biosynthesis protein